MILKTNFTVRVRDIHKILKKTSIGITDFGYENKKEHPIYVPKKREKNVDLLLIKEKCKTLPSYQKF